jgi:hypothetical protein
MSLEREQAEFFELQNIQRPTFNIERANEVHFYGVL